MSILEAGAVSGLVISAEIQRAMTAVQTDEVRDIIRRLGDFGLGVCIPHQHRDDVDFTALPPDTVQVEEDCVVRWVPRSELGAMRNYVPVAWRWSAADGKAVSDIECTKICTPRGDKGHKKGHFPYTA